MRCVAMDIACTGAITWRLKRKLSNITASVEEYVLKQIEPGELVRAIRAVVHGEAYLHPDVMKKVLTRMQPQQSSTISLTPRELEILDWIALPKTYKQIAAQLCVSEETVRSHAKVFWTR
jgi:DNA-binding NarL/FixJ family response regulator